jgi:hypothetical protein
MKDEREESSSEPLTEKEKPKSNYMSFLLTSVLALPYFTRNDLRLGFASDHISHSSYTGRSDFR